MNLLVGFATIVVVIGCGAALARVGVIDAAGQRTLSEVAFFVAVPALMIVTISRVEVGRELLANLATAAIALAVTFALFAAIALSLWKLDVGTVVIGGLSSSYVNAGNLGVAVAAYVVGDTAVVVPTLLVQVLAVQPAALIALDRLTGRSGGALAMMRRVLRTPLTMASVVGLVLAATGWRLPTLVMSPLELLAGLAIPAMLIAYGAALWLSPFPGRSSPRREVALAVVLKLVVMPIIAIVVGVSLGLSGPVLLGVVITAALPTAQNIFLHATRYRVGEDLARESILVSTILSLPVALIITLAMHGQLAS